MKKQRKTCWILLLVAGILTFGPAPFRAYPARDDIKIYKGEIDESVDFIARFPTEEEAMETFNRLHGIVENFRAVLDGESPIDLEDIQNKCRFVLETQKKTEVLEWCLLGLCLDGTVTLLPGEAIEMTLPSYCLDAGKASPSLGEFYSVERISGKQTEWLPPLLEYVSRRPDEGLPVQGLIWNMGKKVAFEDLPEDQQDLLTIVVPDAAKRYGRKPGSKLLGRLADEVKSRVDIIHDIEYTADRINSRKSRLKLRLPKHDTFRLENGLLMKVISTGSFHEVTLVIAYPRVGLGISGSARTVSLAGWLGEDISAGFLHANNFETIPPFLDFFSDTNSGQGTAFGSGFGCGPGFGSSDPGGSFPPILKPSSNPLPGMNSFTASFSKPSLAGQGKWGKTKNWWNNNKGKIEDWSGRAGEAKDLIDSYNEGGLDGVRDHVKGRGFDESLDVFKSFNKGNPEAERAFELFRDFNKSFLDSDKDKDGRGDKGKFKPLRPSGFKFKPGRGDVQPLASSGF